RLWCRRRPPRLARRRRDRVPALDGERDQRQAVRRDPFLDRVAEVLRRLVHLDDEVVDAVGPRLDAAGGERLDERGDVAGPGEIDPHAASVRIRGYRSWILNRGATR